MSKNHPQLQSEPIYDLNLIKKILNTLWDQQKYRAFLLFLTGVSTPFTLEEILALKVKHFVGTEKENIQFYLPKTIPETLYNHLTSLPEEEKLFSETDYESLKQIAKMYGVKDFDRETMRKTFGYQYFQKTRDIRKVEKALNMKPETFTFKYIGYYDEKYYCFYCTKGCLW